MPGVHRYKESESVFAVSMTGSTDDDGRSNFKATPTLRFQEVEQKYAGACVIQ